MKTLTELLKAGGTPTWQEIQQARAREREQLRSWARFPQPGDIYELLEDAEVSYLTHWSAAFTGGGTGTLKKGTRIRVVDDVDAPEPIAVGAHPLDAARVEREIVPEKDRQAEKYAGFSLSVPTVELNRLFRLVDETR